MNTDLNPSDKTLIASKSPAPSQERNTLKGQTSTDSPLWSLQLWSLVTLGSLLLTGGLTRAIRGAFVGKGSWISGVDFVSSRLSQLAAIATILLLVHLALAAIRAARSKILAFAVALLGVTPVIVLMLAQKRSLPHSYSWPAALCGGLALILCAYLSKKKVALRWIAALGGGALLCSALASADFSQHADSRILQLLASLQGIFAWTTLLVLLSSRLWQERKRPILSISVLAVALLLSSTASAASRIDAEGWILLIGRSLGELSLFEVLGTGAPFALCAGLLVALWSLFSSDPKSTSYLIASLITVGVVVPTAPLVVGWLTVCAFATVVVSSNGNNAKECRS